MKQKTGFLLISILLLFSFPAFSQSDLTFDRYHSPEQLEDIMGRLGQHESAEVYELAETAGRNKLLLLEIGPEIRKEKTLPAVITAANMEGTVPLATEAALYLATRLLDNPEMYKDKTWYIIPCGNPDALSRFFTEPLFSDARNTEPYNDDMDEVVDEDGVEDLNGDGIISKMRVRDPEGEWMQVPGEPRLMKKADPSNGETGRYSLYCEGLDNDRDGLYNEDGPGGTNVGINFPHEFDYWTADGGTWPGNSTEARAVLEFVYSHPEIALAVTYGSSNFCF
ncbi:MAG: M14 family zinc carboxypeptidase, partial [Acidobacteriota bacterium]